MRLVRIDNAGGMPPRLLCKTGVVRRQRLRLRGRVPVVGSLQERTQARKLGRASGGTGNVQDTVTSNEAMAVEVAQTERKPSANRRL